MIHPIAPNCCGCNACAEVCPKNCIEMKADDEGFLMPVVDQAACICCGKCDAVCPILNNTEPDGNQTIAYAAINKNAPIRESSSSGGVFHALAAKTLQNGGVVYGAAFTEDFSAVVHLAAENAEDLHKLRGSKYLQSDLRGVYAAVKVHLQTRPVFFTGTPCQVEGLLSYLGKPYDNLLCADVICHGAPSPKAWKIYHQFRCRRAGHHSTAVSFRQKSAGWKNFSIHFSFQDGQNYDAFFSQDPYMQVFLSDVSLRPSCYNCSFKGSHRRSDLTLADFWGVEHVLPEMDDDMGTSLLLVHTNKGEQALQQIASGLQMQPVSLDNALQYNPSSVTPATVHPKRTYFFENLDTMPFDKLAKKCITPKMTPRRILGRIWRKGKQILKQLFHLR